MLHSMLIKGVIIPVHDCNCNLENPPVQAYDCFLQPSSMELLLPVNSNPVNSICSNGATITQNNLTTLT